MAKPERREDVRDVDPIQNPKPRTRKRPGPKAKPEMTMEGCTGPGPTAKRARRGTQGTGTQGKTQTTREWRQ